MPPMSPDRVIYFIIGTVIVLFAAYYVTYFIGMKASGRTRAGMRNRNITVRDQFSVARDKSFCVVEVAGRIYVVGVTNGSMTLLDTFDAEEFDELTEKDGSGPQMPWGDTPVGRYGNRLTKKVVAFVASKTGKTSPYQTSTFTESMKEAQERSSSDKDVSEEDD